MRFGHVSPWRTLGTVRPLALVLILVIAACSGDESPAAAPTQAGTRAPTEGDGVAADFSYIATDGREISLTELTEQYDATVLVFYRGFF